MKPILLLVVVGLLMGAAFCGPGVVPPIPEVSRNFRVELVTDSSKPLTQEQTDAISAGDAVDYMDSHCEKEADGHSGWRRFDVTDGDKQLANEAKVWRDLYAKHGDPPSVVIKSGTKVIATPLPKDTAALKSLLLQYGGK